MHGLLDTMSLSEEVTDTMKLPLKANRVVGKWIQAGRALNQARIVDSDHPELHLRVLDLKRRGEIFLWFLHVFASDIFFKYQNLSQHHRQAH